MRLLSTASRSIRRLGRPPAFARSSSSLADLHRLLASYYSRGQSAEQASEYAEQAHQEFRWLEDAARARSDKDGSDWKARLEGMVKEVAEQDKPLAYVLGTQPFHPLPVELLVRPPTLIPRPETEHWVSLLSQRLLHSSFACSTLGASHRRPFRLLDIGTGTGCIALGLTYALATAAKERRAVEGIAVDRSLSALELATDNAKRCGLLRGDDEPSSTSRLSPSPRSHVSLVQADLFSPSFLSTVLLPSSNAPPSSKPPSYPPSSSQRFDLVVSNPPYIPLHEYEQLERSVREWEDRGALVGELPGVRGEKGQGAQDDGLVFYRRIVSLLPELLVPSSLDGGDAGEGAGPPVVAFEVGKGQARAVERMLLEEGFGAEVIEDPWGVERAVFGFAKR